MAKLRAVIPKIADRLGAAVLRMVSKGRFFGHFSSLLVVHPKVASSSVGTGPPCTIFEVVRSSRGFLA